MNSMFMAPQDSDFQDDSQDDPQDNELERAMDTTYETETESNNLTYSFLPFYLINYSLL